MSDQELAQFIPKYGDRAAVRNFCKLNWGSKKDSDKKSSLIDKLRKRIRGNSYKEETDEEPPKRKITPQKENKQLMIHFGWMHYSNDNKRYKQVREVNGGGTRQIKVPKTAKKYYLIERGRDLFFPNGKSIFGNIENFNVNIRFQNEMLDSFSTVEENLEKTGVKIFRCYLTTQDKFAEKPHTVTSCDLREHSKEGSTDFLEKQNTCAASTSYDINIPNNSLNTTSNMEVMDFNLENSSSHFSNNDELTLLVNSILDESDGLNQVQSIHKVFDDVNQNELSQNSPKSFADILSNLKKNIVPEQISKFNIFRDDIFQCCITAMKRETFNEFHKISVKFSDLEGIAEGAIDEGGPTREMFRVVINVIKDSPMFMGSDKKFVNYNNNKIKANHYFYAARLIALSMVHGGPGPHFFGDTLYSVIAYGEENTVPTTNDVEEEIQTALATLTSVNDINELNNLICNSNVFSIAGIHYATTLESKEQIFQDTLSFYALQRNRPIFEQLICGLKTCGIFEQIKLYPQHFKEVFCDDKTPVTVELFEKLFCRIEYSESGTNKRRVENRIITYFRDYLIDSACPSREGTLVKLLIFATGAESVPPLGFQPEPKISFLHENLSKFPMANTCTTELKLPVVHEDYENFKSDMDFAILNCNDFGFA